MLTYPFLLHGVKLFRLSYSNLTGNISASGCFTDLFSTHTPTGADDLIPIRLHLHLCTHSIIFVSSKLTLADTAILTLHSLVEHTNFLQTGG